MKIILDPSRDGCTVWFADCNTVRMLKGDADEVCKRIYDFATYDYCSERGAKPVREQGVMIALDVCGGYGRTYLDVLEGRYKLKIGRIKQEQDFKI
jgi:hypothetical protein